MNCLSCELKRAKVKSIFLYSVGWSCDRIAQKLSEDYGESYYAHLTFETKVDVWKIMRLSKQAPFEAFLVFEKEVIK